MTPESVRIVASLATATAAAHVRYELIALAALTAHRESDGDDELSLHHIAFTEGHLVHARCLIEFLVGRGKSRDHRDIHPSSFGTSWVAEAATVATMRDWLGEIDVRLAHLSWARLGQAREWQYDSVTRSIVTSFQFFAESVPDRDIRAIFTDGVAQARLHQEGASPAPVADTAGRVIEAGHGTAFFGRFAT